MYFIQAIIVLFELFYTSQVVITIKTQGVAGRDKNYKTLESRYSNKRRRFREIVFNFFKTLGQKRGRDFH